MLDHKMYINVIFSVVNPKQSCKLCMSNKNWINHVKYH